METTITVVNRCSLQKVSADHLPIVKAATDAYKVTLPDLVCSIRLLGSAARGEATLSRSDIDFVALTSRAPSDIQRQEVSERSQQLTANFPVVSKVDLELEIQGRVHPAREFILRTDSALLWGTDDYVEQEVRISNTDLSRLVTPDLEALVGEFRQLLLESKQKARSVSRSVGKDLLKCFRRHLILQHSLYEAAPAAIYKGLQARYPAEAKTWALLWDLYTHPTDNADAILKGLDTAKETDRRMKTFRLRNE